MISVVSAKHIRDYLIELVFSDSEKGIMDFSEYLTRGGIYSRLIDKDYFLNFKVDNQLGTISWDHEFDIAPETLYFKITGKRPEWQLI